MNRLVKSASLAVAATYLQDRPPVSADWVERAKAGAACEGQRLLWIIRADGTSPEQRRSAYLTYPTVQNAA